MNNTMKYVVIAALAVVLVLGFSMLVWSGQEARAENAVKNSVETCIGQMTQGFNAIIETNSLNQGQREFLYNLFRDVFAGKEGSTKELVAFISTMNGTDLNATTLQVMQVVEAQRMAFAACQGNIQTTQLHLENMVTGPFGSMFASMLDRPKSLPASAPARPIIDIDGDGKITVLDYPVIAAQDVINMQSTGIDAGPLDLNATKTPAP